MEFERREFVGWHMDFPTEAVWATGLDEVGEIIYRLDDGKKLHRSRVCLLGEFHIASVYEALKNHVAKLTVPKNSKQPWRLVPSMSRIPRSLSQLIPEHYNFGGNKDDSVSVIFPNSKTVYAGFPELSKNWGASYVTEFKKIIDADWKDFPRVLFYGLRTFELIQFDPTKLIESSHVIDGFLPLPEMDIKSFIEMWSSYCAFIKDFRLCIRPHPFRWMRCMKIKGAVGFQGDVTASIAWYDKHQKEFGGKFAAWTPDSFSPDTLLNDRMSVFLEEPMSPAQREKAKKLDAPQQLAARADTHGLLQDMPYICDRLFKTTEEIFREAFKALGDGIPIDDYLAKKIRNSNAIPVSKTGKEMFTDWIVRIYSHQGSNEEIVKIAQPFIDYAFDTGITEVDKYTQQDILRAMFSKTGAPPNLLVEGVELKGQIASTTEIVLEAYNSSLSLTRFRDSLEYLSDIPDSRKAKVIINAFGKLPITKWQKERYETTAD